MYKLDVEYMKTPDNKIIGMIFCNECDVNATNRIFRHEVPDPNQQGVVGQNKFMSLHYCMTQKYDDLEGAKKEVQSIVESSKIMIDKERLKILDKETFEF